MNPPLPDDDFPQSVQIAEAEFRRHRPDVIVGSSRGGAVAINMQSGETPLILLCPAWKKWGAATTVKPNAIILHSRNDEVVPFADSEELVANSNLSHDTILSIGRDHRLAGDEPLNAMLAACKQIVETSDLVNVTVYYLELLTPVAQSVPEPRDGLTVVEARSPSVRYYRFLYDAVGKDYHWLGRRKLTDAELERILQDPLNEVHVLYVEGTPAGFAELDRSESDEVELLQFGLMPEYIGQGLGKWFLQWALSKAWSYKPKRVWLHTCSLDHPAALPTYTKAGFVQYSTEMIRREL